MPSPERPRPPASLELNRNRGIPLTPYEALQQTAPHDEPVDSYLEILPKIDAVAAAVADLPERDRWIVEAVFWRGMSMQQIATELGVAKSTVHRILHQALDAMRTKLGDTDGINLG